MTADPRPTVAEAQAQLLAMIQPGAARSVPLAEALGLVLHDAVTAPCDVPPHPNAAMDGYAVRAAAIAGATPVTPVQLPVAGVAAAGGGTPAPLAPGTAMRIYTGGVIPAGADTVVRQEDTDLGVETVAITSPRDAFRNVRPAGGDVRAGAIPVPAGAVLTPARLGVLASLGAATVQVIPPPRIGILATGDELARPGEEALVRQGARLGNSNTVALAASVRAAGGVPVLLGPAADDLTAIRNAVRPHRDALDMLVTTGGVSVGDRDLVRPALAGLGVTEHFHRVRLRPGGPTVFGTFADGMPWFGLPGNPVSTMVTFLLFVRPALRRMLGHEEVLPTTIDVEVAEDVAHDPMLELHQRCRFTARPGQLPLASLTGPQGSQLLTSMAAADALLVVPAGAGVTSGGSVMRAVVLG
jgi:molybdopterin molybdotransferase